MEFLRLLLYILLIFVTVPVSFCQSANPAQSFTPPLDIPMVLSGTFGELRSGHFHAGIDIKTQGKTGKTVYVTRKGYISRVKVQSGGYGKAIYISHPGGYTSVYAHLDSFFPDLHNYVTEQQYKQQTHEIDIYLSENKFPVRQGEIIGISGNSGRSGGPHLHFEIRKTNGQIPVNPLKFGFDIEDRIKPVLYKFAVYPLGKNSRVNQKHGKLIMPVVRNNGNYTIPQDPVNVSGKAGFGLEVFDYLNGAPNPCGIYSIKLFIDNIPYYAHRIDQIGFHETRYINSHIDYEEKLKTNAKIQKLFLDPNNCLGIYDVDNHLGIFDFSDDTIHSVHIIVKDFYDNETAIEFKIKSTPFNSPSSPNETFPQFVKTFHYHTKNEYENDQFRIFMPVNSLYTNCDFQYARTQNTPDLYSGIHMVHNKYTPVHKHFDMYIKTQELPESLQEKALVAEIDDEGNLTSTGGSWSDGFIKTSIRNFGKFAVTVDTIPPEIITAGFRENATYSAHQELLFKITDELSGIKSYKGFIDDDWALFELDAKSNTMSYRIDPARLESGMLHKLKLVVEDKKDNRSVYRTSFYY